MRPASTAPAAPRPVAFDGTETTQDNSDAVAVHVCLKRDPGFGEHAVFDSSPAGADFPSHPEFETRTQAIPLDRFSHRGGSWSATDVVQFPNQLDRISAGQLRTASASPPGLHLMDAKLLGPRDHRQYEITFTVRLLSDGPACVSASDAQRLIILGRKELLLPYQGDGKYELKPPTP